MGGRNPNALLYTDGLGDRNQKTMDTKREGNFSFYDQVYLGINVCSESKKASLNKFVVATKSSH